MMSTSPNEGRAARLVCRHVWKIYGESPWSFLPDRSGVTENVVDTVQHIKATNHIPACTDVSFDVSEGEIFVIMGLSGSGKSTIVRCLTRLVEPTAGQIEIDGLDVLRLSESQLIELRRHKMGMVFQNFGLLPHLTVLDNVAYPLRVQGIPRRTRETRALKMVELVGLTGRESAFPRQLSGGMQQRVGIARSLAVEPDIWFLDEPFSALDPLIRRQMQDEFLRLQDVLKKTIVFITHDFLEAIRVADRIAIMRDGQIIQVGRPSDIVLHPVDNYVAEFTRDVPRAKVVTAQEICDVGLVMNDMEDAVRSNETVETVLPRLVGRRRPLAVVDDAGSVIGGLTVDNVLKALVSGRNGESTAQ